MDQATALKILDNYGAPNTPENLAKVMMQGGSQDAILARSMGLQGSVDESGSALDKLALNTQRAPTAPMPTDAGTFPGNPVVAAPISNVRAAAPIARGPVAPASIGNRQLSNSPPVDPMMGPDAPVSTPTPIAAAPTPVPINDMDMDPAAALRNKVNQNSVDQANEPKDRTMLENIAIALGLGGVGGLLVAGGDRAINGKPTKASPRAVIEGGAPTTETWNPKGVPEATPTKTTQAKPKQTPEDVARLKQEVADENAALDKLANDSAAKAKAKRAVQPQGEAAAALKDASTVLPKSVPTQENFTPIQAQSPIQPMTPQSIAERKASDDALRLADQYKLRNVKPYTPSLVESIAKLIRR